MDVLYSIAKGDRRDNIALRYSLRSLEQFGKNLGRVVVVGSPPQWVSDKVEKFRIPSLDPKGAKHDNLMDSIVKAIRSGVVNGEFLFCPEAVFLSKTVDLDDYPFYFKRDRLRSINDLIRASGGIIVTKYKASLADTRNLLERNGFGATEFCCTSLAHMDCKDVDEVARLWLQDPHADWGYEPISMFMNVREFRSPVERTLSREVKLKDFRDEERVFSQIEDAEAFTAHDNAFDNNRFLSVLNAMFPNKSKYEM